MIHRWCGTQNSHSDVTSDGTQLLLVHLQSSHTAGVLTYWARCCWNMVLSFGYLFPDSGSMEFCLCSSAGILVVWRAELIAIKGEVKGGLGFCPGRVLSIPGFCSSGSVMRRSVSVVEATPCP